MKSLLLIRHAKSSWENFSVADFDRPLNDRGKRDAPMMAARLAEKGIVPDRILVSPAKRTRKTATYFMNAWELPDEKMQMPEELYLASPAIFRKLIQALPDELENIAVISHNNGLTDFANELTNVRVDNIPTCGIFGVKIAIDSWQGFENAEKEFWFFDYPKQNLTGL